MSTSERSEKNINTLEAPPTRGESEQQGVSPATPQELHKEGPQTDLPNNQTKDNQQEGPFPVAVRARIL